MNIWHDISPDRITKTSFDAVIEISKGSKMKYEHEVSSQERQNKTKQGET